MSQAVITLAFEQWKAKQAATDEAVTLDEFVFANVPGLDIEAPIDREEAMPPAAQIVHRQAVSRKGVVNDNAVVHSVVLGADVGDFTFNWVGLINKASGTLAMIVHAPEQQKLKTKEGQQGNVLTRSFLMEYNGAQAETQINTPAETWQIDFTARMAGMDERQRLENLDIYGAGAFFDDGYLVAKSGTQYYITKGAGYVAGLRSVLAANQNIVIAAKPVKVWLDVCWSGSLTSVWTVQSKITVVANLADYVQSGVQHYVFAIASIDTAGNITDLRPKGTLGDQQGNKVFLRKDANLSDLTDPSKARNSLELKKGAVTDIVTSPVDTTPGRIPTVGWMGLGGAELSIADGTDIYKYFASAKSGFYGGGGALTNTLTYGWHSFKWQQHGSDNKYGLLLEFGGDGKTAVHIYNNANGDMVNPEKYWSGGLLYGEKNKPSASDVGALPIGGGTLGGPLTVNGAVRLGSIGNGILNIGDSDSGLRSSVDGQVDLWANNVKVGHWKTGTFSFTGEFVPTNYANFDARYQVKGDYIAQDVCNVAGFRSGDVTLPYMRHTSSNAVVELATKSWSTTTFQPKGDYTPAGQAYTKAESDGRYYTKAQSDAGYMPKTSAYVKAESDARYQLKNTASKAANGWHKDTSTGVITQWGTASGGGDDQYYTVNTPIAFPAAFTSLQVFPIYPGAITGAHTLTTHGKINSTSQFGYGVCDGSSSSVSAQGVYWEAKGY
ncbi:phage tail protein [Pseudocitrobacter sp. 73]|uniref:phage tail protein n=1 Tax=Pseudocitrobacter sp. 73 TaxID=2605731 RepID=UPI002107B23A|nr:phage tail protein [Pseudocitrobacter sp. 73]